jgi:uncharacterized iron-regulated membrane protein
MAGNTFYRRVWRWHFWAGLVCAPLLVVTALTGAVYVFKDELESAGRAQLAYVAPTGERKPFDELLAAARTAYPGESPAYATLYAAADRAAVIQLQRKDGPRTITRLVFVNPYTAQVLGDEPLPGRDNFFDVVVRLHTHLYVGRPGHILVELVTSWTVVLTVTGIYLWWPRILTDVLGVWFPRFRSPAYTILRDLHSIPGVVLSVVIILLAITGLFFSSIWGSGYSAIVGQAGAYPFELTEAPKRPAVNGLGVPINSAVEEAKARWPEATLMLELAQKPTSPHAVTARNPTGDMVFGFVAVDRATGEVVADRNARDVPFPAQVRLWVYPIHVGSIYGTPTKVLAVIGCLVLIFAAVSGVAMWLVRRPAESSGFPAASDARVPMPAVVTILVLAVLLPAVGLSLLLVLAGESIWENLPCKSSTRGC